MEPYTLSEQEWKLSHQLARALAGKMVSPNQVKQAMAYASQFPPDQAPRALIGWLQRLTQLGETFASGKKADLERENLMQVLSPALKNHPDLDWRLLLGWIARLMLYYAPRATSTKPRGGRR